MKHYSGKNQWLVAAIIGALVLYGFLVGSPALAEDGVFDLEATVSVQEHVAPGMAYDAKINYRNLGITDSPDDTQVIVTLPAGVAFVAAVDQHSDPLTPVTIQDSILTFDVGVIKPGDCTDHIRITLQVGDDLAEGTDLPVQVEIVPSSGDSDPLNNLAIDSSQVCDMAGSTKQVNAHTVRPGDVLTYTIQLRLAQRNGPNANPPRDITLTDPLAFAHQVRFLGWSGPIEGDWDGHTLRWQGQVKAGEPLTLQYRLGVEGDTAPGTVLTNTAMLEYGGMQYQLGPVTTTVEMPGNAAMIGPLGYHWQVAAGLTVEVPPNAVKEMTRFEFQPLFENEIPEPPEGNLFAHQAFELNAFQFGELHQFDQPLTLRFGTEGLNGLQRESLQLWYRNNSGEPWLRLGPPVENGENQLAFRTNHFTQFALFGQGKYHILLPLIFR